ncbi:hypothetical protein SCLCIDRAFT_1219988 [Scleroderma citrinum Foug A]|uniref:4Fe-4S ferredoxin-type domain-containing protein n=1 Tax=Scleroderma citrinum Foug A TaxID=1036808 RepID=A0A0C3D870_9AGAM|nr:hypothetical protein SCLCIDRAFT_1219988 [Scleroderma citrinum Foug A]
MRFNFFLSLLAALAVYAPMSEAAPGSLSNEVYCLGGCGGCGEVCVPSMILQAACGVC